MWRFLLKISPGGSRDVAFFAERALRCSLGAGGKTHSITDGPMKDADRVQDGAPPDINGFISP